MEVVPGDRAIRPHPARAPNADDERRCRRARSMVMPFPWEAEAGPETPARGFLLRCGRRELGDEALGRLRAAGERLDAADWTWLLSTANAEGMAPLVFKHAAGAGLLAAMPADIAAELRRAYAQTLVNNRRMLTALGALLDELAARGVEALALKGPALARRLYGEPALRPMRDLDLLVRRPDVPLACDALRRLGYAPPAGSGRPTGFNAQTHAVVEYERADGPKIEVHWELFGSAAYRRALPAAEAWRRAGRIQIAGRPARYLDTADELRYLSVHAAAEHHLERLIWSVDIAELAGALPGPWDWGGFVRGTITAGLALPVAVALSHCHRALDLALPSGVLDELVRAAGAPGERATWARAQAPDMSPEWIAAQASVLRGGVERAVFARGVLAPRVPELTQLYGTASVRRRALPVTYARHWRRVGLPLLRALLDGGALGRTLGRARRAGGLRRRRDR